MELYEDYQDLFPILVIKTNCFDKNQPGIINMAEITIPVFACSECKLLKYTTRIRECRLCETGKYMEEINIVHQNICGPGLVIDDTPTSIQYSTVQRLSNKTSQSWVLDNIIVISKLSDTLYWFQLTDVTFMKFTAELTTEFVSVYNVKYFGTSRPDPALSVQ